MAETDTVDAIADALARDDGGSFERIQTHISHLFLTNDRVFKMRKSVRFDFLDFSTRTRRNEDCLDELVLNRRLAEGVYEGVAPVEPCAGGYRVGKVRRDCSAADLDPAREHVVVMQRLAAATNAKALLERDALNVTHIESVVRRVLAFHDANVLGTSFSSALCDWSASIGAPALGNFESMRTIELGGDWRRLVDEVEDATAVALTRLGAEFERRASEARFVDGHGDLRLEHIWFPSDGPSPTIIDCVEFNREFRWMDRASEMAFLAMDLEYYGRSDLARVLIERYAAVSDDYHLYRVIDFYQAYRATVRAKVAALTACEPEVPDAQRDAAAGSALRHLTVAARCLAAPQAGAVVCMTGTVGSGKSTLARRIADRVGAVVVSTDAVRKAVERDATRESAEQRYTAARREEIYVEALERASNVVESGRTVVLDATFETERLRGLALEWARARGLQPVLVRARVSADVARERLAARKREGRGDSEAGPSELEASLARYEDATQWPSELRVSVDTEAGEAALNAALTHVATLTRT